MAKASAARCEWLTSARSPQQQLDTNMVFGHPADEGRSAAIRSSFSGKDPQPSWGKYQVSLVIKYADLTYHVPSVAPSLTARKPTDVAKRGPIHSDNAPRRCRTELPKRVARAGARWNPVCLPRPHLTTEWLRTTLASAFRALPGRSALRELVVGNAR